MHRDLLTILVILAVSAGMAVASNLGWHKLDWIRSPKKDGANSATTQNGKESPATQNSDSSAVVRKGADQTATRSVGKPKTTQNSAGAVAAEPAALTIELVHEYWRSETARFVDAREEREYVEGHLLGSTFLPASAVYERIESVTTMIQPDEKVIVFCAGNGCEAAHIVADVLQNDFHYTDVLVYEGGWEEILSSGKFNDCLVVGEDD
ncbi:MAG: rhodanese-like domain-containing protein [Phycisphaerae bacterium]|nr:rhodanese-like domain-containing protein [Phycisphaerae bacterium]